MNRFERRGRRVVMAIAALLPAWQLALLACVLALAVPAPRAGAAIASGTGLVNSLGDLIVNAEGDGRVADGQGGAGDKCCCQVTEPAPDECPYCNGSTPKYAKISMGLANCPGCASGGTIDDLCLVATGECTWATTRSFNCCKLRCNGFSQCMTAELDLTNDGAGGGRLTLDVPGVFFGFTDGVSTCVSVTIANTLVCGDPGVASGAGGQAVVTWGNCDPGCPGCSAPKPGECDCSPDHVVVNLSGIDLDTRFCPPDRPDLVCLECDSSETVSASVMCLRTDPEKTEYFGETSITSGCGFNGVKITNLRVKVFRGGCRWQVGAVVDNDGNGVASTIFCGETGIADDCQLAAVASNLSTGTCYQNVQGCTDIVCPGLIDEGSPIGSGGSATVVPC